MPTQTKKRKVLGLAKKGPADNSKEKRGLPTTPPKEPVVVQKITATQEIKHQDKSALRAVDRKKVLIIAYRFASRTIDADQVTEELVALLAKPATTGSGRTTEDVNPLDARYNELVRLLSDMITRLTSMARDKMPVAKSIVRSRR